jgi:hypothetical protein
MLKIGRKKKLERLSGEAAALNSGNVSVIDEVAEDSISRKNSEEQKEEAAAPV